MTDGRDESLFGSDALILQGLTGLEEEIAEMANEEAALNADRSGATPDPEALPKSQPTKEETENWNRVSPRPMAPPPGKGAAEDAPKTTSSAETAEPAAPLEPPTSAAPESPAPPVEEVVSPPAARETEVRHLSAREMQKARQQTAAQKRSAIRRREIEELMSSDDPAGDNPLFLKSNGTATSRIVAAPDQPPLEPLEPPQAKAAEAPGQTPLRPQEPRPMQPPSTPMAPPDLQPAAPGPIESKVADPAPAPTPTPVAPAPAPTPVAPAPAPTPVDPSNPFTAVTPSQPTKAPVTPPAARVPAETQPVGDRPPVSIETPRARTEAVTADLLSPPKGSDFETAVPKRIVEPEPDPEGMIEKNLLDTAKPAWPVEALPEDERKDRSTGPEEEDLSLGGDPQAPEPRSRRRKKTRSHRVRSGRDSESRSLRHTDDEAYQQEEPRPHRSARSGSFWPALLSATFLNLLLLALVGLLLWPLVKNKVTEFQTHQQEETNRQLKVQNLVTQIALSGSQGSLDELQQLGRLDEDSRVLVAEKEKWLRDYFEDQVENHPLSPAVLSDLKISSENELLASDCWQILSKKEADVVGRFSESYSYPALDRARAAYHLKNIGALADVNNKAFVDLLDDEKSVAVVVAGIAAFSDLTGIQVRGIDVGMVKDEFANSVDSAPES
ncbi:MAG: hypothetical protein AAF514_01790 [Verrucomicrobiota bacterium]